MIQRVMLLTAALLMLVGVPASMAQTPDEVHQKVSKAIDVEAKVQKKADDWSWNKQDLVDEIRDLKTRVTWLQYQKEKHRIYIQRVQENIADLETLINLLEIHEESLRQTRRILQLKQQSYLKTYMATYAKTGVK